MRTLPSWRSIFFLAALLLLIVAVDVGFGPVSALVEDTFPNTVGGGPCGTAWFPDHDENLYIDGMPACAGSWWTFRSVSGLALLVLSVATCAAGCFIRPTPPTTEGTTA